MRKDLRRPSCRGGASSETTLLLGQCPVSTPSLIRLATRASRLALWQARHVEELIVRVRPQIRVEVVEVSTLGDRDRESRLAEMGGVGVFTREVQKAVLDVRADVAVHSLKDLPTEPAPGLELAGVPVRGPRGDVVVLPAGRTGASLEALPHGARVATGSLRRRAQLLHRRPDLIPCDVRGNVETRLRKLDAGEFDALILAEAGLVRLGLAERIAFRCDPGWMLPAVGQAALGLECRASDEAIATILRDITDPRTAAEVRAERSCLATLRAGCHAPVGVLVEWPEQSGALRMEGVVLSPDGRRQVAASIDGNPQAPVEAGRRLAEQLLAHGAAELLTADVAPQSEA